MDLQQAVIGLTERPETLDRLRRLGRLQKDKKTGKEFLFAQYNGQSIPFFVGESRTLPREVAEGLERDNHTPSTEKCMHCKGTGTTPAGICINCRGKKEVLADEIFRILKISRTFDPMLMDPNEIPDSASVAVETARLGAKSAS